jgi:hypothetical protein
LAATYASAPVVAKVADFGLSGLENTIADRVVENPGKKKRGGRGRERESWN